MLVTINALKTVFPNTPTAKLQSFVEPFNKLCPLYGINTLNRMAAFIAQTGHESGGFNFTVENLNYSADGLKRVFGKYFPTQVLADRYARQPQRIANRVYANRMGNGPETSGDGWKYRGRGIMQVTGKANYTAFAAFIERSIDDTVAYLETVEGAVMGAIWFWQTHDLNALADKGDLLTMTKRINGGTNGLQDRVTLFGKMRLALR